MRGLINVFLVSEVEDEITFWGLELEDIELRNSIDDRINECYQNGSLSSIKGSPEEGALVLAPFFEQNNQQPTYHRAIIIKPSIKINDTRNIEYSFVRFVDYGNYKEVPQQSLRFIEDECLFIHRSNMALDIVKIPLLAVKYRLV